GLARSALDARASACRARRLDDGASARAARTRPAERERALVVFDRTAATALRADDGRRARSRAAAATGVTCHLAGEVDGGGDAVDGVEEREVQLRLEVVAPARTNALTALATTATAKKVAEQVAEPTEVAHVLGREREAPRARARAARTGTEPARHRPEAPDLVVGLALLGVGQHVVGRRDVLEPILVAGVGVGMVLL